MTEDFFGFWSALVNNTSHLGWIQQYPDDRTQIDNALADLNFTQVNVLINAAIEAYQPSLEDRQSWQNAADGYGVTSVRFID